MIKVSALMFAAANRFISTDETRYYISGVNIEPCHLGGALLIGTDGHRLLCIHDPNGECTKSAIVKLRADMLTACAPQTTEWQDDEWEGPTPHTTTIRDRVLLVSDDGIAEVGGALRQIEPCIIDGTFPNWRKTIPDINGAAGISPAFNGRYLGDFAEVAGLLAESSSCRIRIVFGADILGPSVVFFSDFPTAFGIVMPLKDGNKAQEIPAFARLPQPVAA